MDFHEYAMQLLVDEKLRSARLQAAHRGLIAQSRGLRPTLRARLGAALIALGKRLAEPAHRPAPRTSHG